MLHSRPPRRLHAERSRGALNRSFGPAYAAWLPIASQYFLAPEHEYEAFRGKLRHGAPARRRAVRQIIDLPPVASPEDTALKLMAAVHERADLWGQPAKQLGQADRATRALIESAALLTGVALPCTPAHEGARS